MVFPVCVSSRFQKETPKFCTDAEMKFPLGLQKPEHRIVVLPREVVFVEYTPTGFTREIVRLFDGHRDTLKVSAFEGDVCLVPRRGAAFVSPGNSLGFMDGGIDYAYSRTMFPGCEAKIRDEIKRVGKETNLGRPYLPVGSALTVAGFDEGCLIFAPTMFLPHDVSRTRNAYHAFFAALGAFDKLARSGCHDDVRTLVCPALCCGYGRMDPAKSAAQVHEAFRDRLVIPTADLSGPAFPRRFITPSKDEEQPDNYDNREIKHVDFRFI